MSMFVLIGTAVVFAGCWVFLEAYQQRLHDLCQQRAVLRRMVDEGRATDADLFAFDEKYPEVRRSMPNTYPW